MKPTYRNTLTMLRESNAIEDEYERSSLVQAHRAWNHLQLHGFLTPRIIKEAHAILMKNQLLNPYYKGDWRDMPVVIGGKFKHQPKIVIASLIDDFCTDINQRPYAWLQMHIRFEEIHPFLDGNGRMGRLIMNWHRCLLENKLAVFTAERKHDIYYPIFSDGPAAAERALQAIERGEA